MVGEMVVIIMVGTMEVVGMMKVVGKMVVVGTMVVVEIVVEMTMCVEGIVGETLENKKNKLEFGLCFAWLNRDTINRIVIIRK